MTYPAGPRASDAAEPEVLATSATPIATTAAHRRITAHSAASSPARRVTRHDRADCGDRTSRGTHAAGARRQGGRDHRRWERDRRVAGPCVRRGGHAGRRRRRERRSRRGDRVGAPPRHRRVQARRRVGRRPGAGARRLRVRHLRRRAPALQQRGRLPRRAHLGLLRRGLPLARRREPLRRDERSPQLRAPHDRAGRGPHREHRLGRELRVDAPPRPLLLDQARDRRPLRGAALRARRHRRRRERARPRRREHQHRRLDGAEVGDRRSRDHRGRAPCSPTPSTRRRSP